MFAVRFSRLVYTIGDKSSSDTNMARRCVGWASVAVTPLIWQLDMADWLGSRTQLKHLCCSCSCITPGPNKTLGSRHAKQGVANTQRHTLPVPASKDCSGTCRLHGESCHFCVPKSRCRMHKKGKCDKAALARTHTHAQDLAAMHSSAHTQL